jgi:hypothetical protein
MSTSDSDVDRLTRVDRALTRRGFAVLSFDAVGDPDLVELTEDLARSGWSLALERSADGRWRAVVGDRNGERGRAEAYSRCDAALDAAAVALGNRAQS